MTLAATHIFPTDGLRTLLVPRRCCLKTQLLIIAKPDANGVKCLWVL